MSSNALYFGQIFMKFGVRVLYQVLDNIEFFESRLIEVFYLSATTDYMFATQFGQSSV